MLIGGNVRHYNAVLYLFFAFNSRVSQHRAGDVSSIFVVYFGDKSVAAEARISGHLP